MCGRGPGVLCPARCAQHGVPNAACPVRSARRPRSAGDKSSCGEKVGGGPWPGRLLPGMLATQSALQICTMSCILSLCFALFMAGSGGPEAPSRKAGPGGSAYHLLMLIILESSLLLEKATRVQGAARQVRLIRVCRAVKSLQKAAAPQPLEFWL